MRVILLIGVIILNYIELNELELYFLYGLDFDLFFEPELVCTPRFWGYSIFYGYSDSKISNINNKQYNTYVEELNNMKLMGDQIGESPLFRKTVANFGDQS